MIKVVFVGMFMVLVGSVQATLVMEYLFNQTGTSAAEDGGSLNQPVNLQQNQGSSPSAFDFHTAGGNAPSGMGTDRALSLTNVTDGAAVHGGDEDAIDGLTAFTLVAWVHTPASVAGQVLMDNHDGSSGFQFSMAGGDSATLTVDGGSISPNGASFIWSGQWIMLAVTYDGSSSANNVQWWKGNASGFDMTQWGSSVTLNQGTVGGEAEALAIGNDNDGGNSFNGMIDNVRVYDTVLTELELEAIQTSDFSPIPEASTMHVVIIGLFMLGWCRKNFTDRRAFLCTSRRFYRI